MNPPPPPGGGGGGGFPVKHDTIASLGHLPFFGFRLPSAPCAQRVICQRACQLQRCRAALWGAGGGAGDAVCCPNSVVGGDAPAALRRGRGRGRAGRRRGCCWTASREAAGRPWTGPASSPPPVKPPPPSHTQRGMVHARSACIRTSQRSTARHHHKHREHMHTPHLGRVGGRGCGRSNCCGMHTGPCSAHSMRQHSLFLSHAADPGLGA